jgi:hypothetical protein
MWQGETVQPYGALSCAEQHLNGTARFGAQTGKFVLREQALGANLGQHRECLRAPRIVEQTRYFPITLFDNSEDLEVARMVTLPAIA